MPMTLATITTILNLVDEYGPVVADIVKKYGPALKEIGVDLAKVYEFLRQYHDHPNLTVGQRQRLYAILNSEPSSLNGGV